MMGLNFIASYPLNSDCQSTSWDRGQTEDLWGLSQHQLLGVI